MLSLRGVVIALQFVLVALSSAYEWDEMGYVLYCPCMGRFGNQAEHFLGALAFAKRLNRTLAVPPWRSYAPQRNVPYTDFFQLSPLLSYHRVLTLEGFLAHLAPSHWPPGNRTGYCSHRPQRDGCGMKEGNPFGPFWTELGVDFDRSESVALSYNVDSDNVVKMWQENYPPLSHPVLAFKGAPASYPVREHNRPLQAYVQWSATVSQWVDRFIEEAFGGDAFVGVHLRMGIDWERACQHSVGHASFMSSYQCLGAEEAIAHGMCLPSRQGVGDQLGAALARVGLGAVFVASDVDPDVKDLQRRLGPHVKVVYRRTDVPQLDLAVLARAQHFIGNCISSFTAFVSRERREAGLPVEYWGMPPVVPPEAVRDEEHQLPAGRSRQEEL